MAGNRVSLVRLFNTADWTYVDLPGLHKNPELMRYSNDGRYLAVLENRTDGLSNLKIYDLSNPSQAQLSRTIVIEQLLDRMDGFAFCPTGDYLVIGWNLGEKLRVYKTADWTIVETAFRDAWLDQTLVNGVKFSSDGTRMYVCGTTSHPDGAIAVYDMVNWVRLPQYKVPEIQSTYWMDVSSTKNQIAVYDGRVLRFVSMANWTIQSEVFVEDGEHAYTGVDYSEDGAYVAVIGGNSGAVVYNTTTYQIASELTEMGVSRGGSAVFDKRLPIAASFDRVDAPVSYMGAAAIVVSSGIEVYELSEQALLLTITNESLNTEASPEPYSTAMSPNGELVFGVWSDLQPDNGNES